MVETPTPPTHPISGAGVLSAGMLLYTSSPSCPIRDRLTETGCSRGQTGLPNAYEGQCVHGAIPRAEWNR